MLLLTRLLPFSQTILEDMLKQAGPKPANCPNIQTANLPTGRVLQIVPFGSTVQRRQYPGLAGSEERLSVPEAGGGKGPKDWPERPFP